MTGVDAAIAALAGIDIDAQRSQKSAWRATRRAAATGARRALASRWGVPQNVFRARVQMYIRPRAPETARLWLGLKRRPSRGEHKRVAKAINAIGDRRLRYLPIEQGAESMLKASALNAMTTRYGPVLRRDYKRRLARRIARAGKGKR